MPVTTKDRKQTARGRFYEIEGVEYVSVTNVLSVISKPALINWAAKVERDMVIEVSGSLYRDLHGTPKMTEAQWITTIESRLGKEKAHRKEIVKAAELGSQAHALIEWTIRKKMGQEVGPCPKIEDKALWAFMAWEDWAKSVDFKPLLVEQVVYSETFGYAGTLDLFAEVKGVPTVCDWKTGKAVYAEAHLQNAAYRSALREMKHGDAKAGLILRLPKVDTDPNFEAVECLPEAECMETFIHFYHGWKWQAKMDAAYEEKKAAQKPAESPSASQAAAPTPATTETPAKAAKPAKAPISAARVPPLGMGKLLSFTNGEIKLKNGDLLGTLRATNRSMDIGGKKMNLFDMLKLAVGMDCAFSVADGKDHWKVDRVVRVGPYEWEQDGTPVIRRDAEPLPIVAASPNAAAVSGELYQATDDVVPF